MLRRLDEYESSFRKMISRLAWLALLAAAECAAAPLRIAVFRAEVTPPAGEPLIWITPVTEVLDPLWAKGVVLEDGRSRYVLCAVDWCGIGGSSHRLFRAKIARAAGAAPANVAVHAVHQHTAPYVDGDAYRLVGQLPHPPLRLSQAFLEQVTGSIAASVRKAVRRLQPFDHAGAGEAEVERVASARRILAGGKLITRFSTGGRDPALSALPEGPIDPFLKTITFAAGDKPLARLHYYAAHPQTFCCDGRVSGDFVSAAREALEKEEGVPQIYFTGCAGDVTVGKYNDGSARAREELTQRLLRGMKQAAAATRFSPVSAIRWRAARLRLPPKPEPDWRSKLGQDAYTAAIAAAFARREQSLDISAIEVGPAAVVHLPGEPMLEFQRFAQGLRAGSFVAVAGYGDISSGYLCTDRAHGEGGYEPSASHAGPGTETALKNAIRALLGQ